MLPKYNVFLVLAMAMVCFPALAYEPLQEAHGLSMRENMGLHALIRGHAGSDVQIKSVFRVDLNRDGLDEFIIKTNQCADDAAVCTYLISAEQEDDFILIGEIKARHIALADEYVSGVRSLVAFQNADNDFASARYVWAAAHSRYILKE